MKYADIILTLVDMSQVADRYGLSINRQGFTHCPFHKEKTASLKIYTGDRGYYCFGCGAGGDVIDFVQKMFHLDHNETIEKINDDFNLNLPINKKMTIRQSKRLKEIQHRLEAERIQRIQAQREFDIQREYETTELVRLDTNLRLYKPSEDDTELHPLFIEALHNIDRHYYYNYLNYSGGGMVDNNRNDQRANSGIVGI